ncbi:hypothetical protein ACULNC_10335 [Shigella flexneri]
MLAQRPPSGLWGGLYCFPQFADEESCGIGWHNGRLLPIT